MRKLTPISPSIGLIGADKNGPITKTSVFFTKGDGFCHINFSLLNHYQRFIVNKSMSAHGWDIAKTGQLLKVINKDKWSMYRTVIRSKDSKIVGKFKVYPEVSGINGFYKGN